MGAARRWGGRLLASLALGAYCGVGAQPLTLHEAVTQALQRNPAITAAAAERDTARHQLAGARWSRFPTVSSELAPGTAGGAGTVRVEQPLWTGGRITGQIDAAAAQADGADAGERETRRGLAEQVAVTYLSATGAEHRRRLVDDGRAVFERLLEFVRRREAAGVAAVADVSIASARLAAVGTLGEQLAAEHRRALAELESLVVGRVDALAAPPPVPLPDGFGEAGDASADEALAAAYRAASDLVAQRRAEVRAAQAGVAVSRGQTLPTLGLRVESVRSPGAPAGADRQTRASVALQFAPGAGLSAAAAVDAARSRVTVAEERLRGTEVELRLRARTQRSEIATARAQVAQTEAQIDALQATADSYLRQFEAGRRSWIEVLNVHREVLDTRVALSRLVTQRDQAVVRLLANTGELPAWIDTTRP